MSTPQITGELSMTLEDGRTLHAGNEVELARAWVEAELGPRLALMSSELVEEHVSEAVRELRRPYRESL